MAKAKTSKSKLPKLLFVSTDEEGHYYKAEASAKELYNSCNIDNGELRLPVGLYRLVEQGEISSGEVTYTRKRFTKP